MQVLERHEPVQAYGDWRDEVCSWWNSRLDASLANAKAKPKHLYLWGASNTGKTRFIKHTILRNVDESSILYPNHNIDLDRFEMSAFDMTSHSVCLWDEFELRSSNWHMLPTSEIRTPIILISQVSIYLSSIINQSSLHNRLYLYIFTFIFSI